MCLFLSNKSYFSLLLFPCCSICVLRGNNFPNFTKFPVVGDFKSLMDQFYVGELCKTGQYHSSSSPKLQAVPLPSFRQFPSLHSGSSPPFIQAVPPRPLQFPSFIQAVSLPSFRHFPFL